MIIGHDIVGWGARKVIALHGWFGDHRVWQPMYPFLDRDKFSYAFLDYRGYGMSRSIAGAHTIKEIAADAIALADHLGWNRFFLVGHSMGGMAVQRVAVDAMSRVQAIVAITPVPASGEQLPPEVQKMFESVVHDDEAGMTVLGVSLGQRLSPTVPRHILRFARETTTPQAFSDYLRAFTKSDFSAEAKAIKAPMLVLVGEHDQGRTLDSVKSAFPPLHPHARIEIIPNSGHYPMLEVPAYLATRIEAYLSEH